MVVDPGVQLEIEKIRFETYKEFSRHDLALTGLLHAVEKLHARIDSEIASTKHSVEMAKGALAADIQSAKNDMIRWTLGTVLTVGGIVAAFIYVLLRMMGPAVGGS